MIKIFEKLKKDEKGYARVVGTVVAALVVIVIGLIVFVQVSDSIKLTDATAQTVQSNVNSTAATVFSLAPIIVIVLVAGIILGVVSRFGGTSGGGL